MYDPEQNERSGQYNYQRPRRLGILIFSHAIIIVKMVSLGS